MAVRELEIAVLEMKSDERHWLPLFNRCPPWICRWLSRKKHGTRPMSIRDIAAVSGISRAGCAKIKEQGNWNRVLGENIHRFSLACGVNLLSQSSQRDFLRRRKLVYQRFLTPPQRREFDRLEKAFGSRKNPSA